MFQSAISLAAIAGWSIGDEEGWAALWAEDGVFAGVMPEPVVGREALKAIPRGAFASSGGKLRHHVGSLNCDYDAGGKDVVIARYYNLVTNWVQRRCIHLHRRQHRAAAAPWRQLADRAQRFGQSGLSRACAALRSGCDVIEHGNS